ncbi:Stage 0 sporulation A-like protein, partial [Dysosmobacter welbionis]
PPERGECGPASRPRPPWSAWSGRPATGGLCSSASGRSQRAAPPDGDTCPAPPPRRSRSSRPGAPGRSLWGLPPLRIRSPWRR